MKRKIILMSVTFISFVSELLAQPVMQTGGQKMPAEWIDQDTHHRVKRLTQPGGNFASFYFHNNPFIKSVDGKSTLMIFYGNDAYHGDGRGRQLWRIDLQSGKTEQLTTSPSPKSGEIVGTKRREVFYQTADSVFATHIDTKATRLVYVFPDTFKASITTLNADETLLSGAKSSEEEKEIYRKYPDKSNYFERIYDAHLERVLFTLNVDTKALKAIYRENAWLNHIQFSPTDPNLLMYCHEGPWHKVDRIWTIDLKTGRTQLMHKRTMDMEIAGHEWIAADGKTIWYDLQMPKGETFYVAGVNIASQKMVKYQLQRNEWSVHYTLSPSQKLFAGDGGDPGAVAKAPDGQWIYLFRPQGDHFESEKLVNMKFHKYKFEPNVHFTPDEKWVIFRANFEGEEQIYAVEIEPAKQ